MIDIEEYRLQEALAINNLNSWRPRQTHFLPTMQQVGFPSRYENLSRLRHFINTFQENRFESYMAEDGGIAEQEIELLTSVIIRNLNFQEFTFSGKKQIVPFDSAMAALKVYSSIFALKPDCKRILEIGPGSGFLPQFLHFSDIENYVGIEACESLYMLQDLQFSYLFGPEFNQCALGGENTSEVLVPKAQMPYGVYVNEYEISREVEKYRFIHIPWWEIGKLVDENMSFDIVTSNANLTEFSVQALKDYLYLISKCLKEGGIFVVYCFGGGSTSRRVVFQNLEAYGFAPVYLKRATVYIAFYVKEDHPLFSKSYHPNLLQKGTKYLKRRILEKVTPPIIQEFAADTELMKNYLNTISKAKRFELTKEQLFDIIKSKYLADS